MPDDFFDNLGKAPPTAPPVQQVAKPISAGDDFFDNLGKSAPAAQTQQSSAGGPTMRAHNIQDTIRDVMSNSFRPALTGVGSVVGGALATPADIVSGPIGTATGSLVGAGVGSYTANALQKMFPEWLGHPAENILDPAKEAAGQELGGKIGEAGSRAGFSLLQKAGRSMFPTKEGFPLGESLSQGPDVRQLIQNASGKAQKTQTLYNNAIESQKSYLAPVYQGKRLNDANSYNFAQQELTNPHPSLGSGDLKLLQQAGKGNFQDNLRLKEALDQRLSGENLSDPNLAPNKEILRGFSKSLNQDIDAGFQKLGPQYYKDWKSLNDSYIAASNTLDPVLSQKLLSFGTDPKTTYEQIAKQSLVDATHAQQFLNVTGDRQTLSTLAIKKAVDTGLDPQSRTFDAGRVLQELKAHPEIYKTAIPSQTLSNYTQIFSNLANNQAKNSGPKVLSAYKTGIYLQGGLSLLGLGMGHTGYAATAGLGMIGLKLSNSALTKAMQSPTVLRALVEGSKTPLQAASGSTTAKIIANGLKGVTGLSLVRMDNPDAEIPVQIDDSGKMVMDQ